VQAGEDVSAGEGVRESVVFAHVGLDFLDEVVFVLGGDRGVAAGAVDGEWHGCFFGVRRRGG
jgi:hypothetical protein